MQVKKDQLVALYRALGVDTADGWDVATLTKKTNTKPGITRYREPGQNIDDPELLTLYDQLATAAENDELVELESDGPVTEEAPVPVTVKKLKKPVPKKPAGKVKTTSKKPVPKKPAPKGKKKSSGRYDGHADWKSYAAHLKKNPKKLDPDKGTVIAETYKLLRSAATQKEPVTKEEILAVLKDKFPARKEEELKVTLDNNVPGRLRWMYGIHTWTAKTDDGIKVYYVPGDGKMPQPKTEKKSKPVAPKPMPKLKVAKKVLPAKKSSKSPVKAS